MNWIKALKRHVKLNPNKPLVTAKGDTKTYGEVLDLSQRFASFLQKTANVQKGDSVVCRASQSVSYFITLTATLLLEAVFVPFEKDCSVQVIERACNQLGNVKAMVGDSQKDIDVCANFVDSSSVIDLALQSELQQREDPKDDSVSIILFTTGTTGTSKGAVTTHRQLQQCDLMGTTFGYDENTNVYIAGSTNHIGFLAFAVCAVYKGASFIISQGLTNLKDVFTALKDHKANAMFATVSGFNMLFLLCKEQLKSYSKQLKIIITGSEKCSEKDQKALLENMPDSQCFLLYGLTEGGFWACSHLNESTKEYCVGRMLDNVEVFALAENGELCSDGTQGRLVAKTPYSMKYYLCDQEKTNEVLKGEFVHSDDLGYVQNGEVFVLGRMGNVIISGGFKINPYEVENTANEFEGVENSVCVGKKHELLGQTVHLVVQSKTEINKQKLLDWIKTKLESFKVPKTIDIVCELKKNKNGKIDRKYYCGD